MKKKEGEGVSEGKEEGKEENREEEREKGSKELGILKAGRCVEFNPAHWCFGAA